uniref:OTU domain-containing protein n=1 Tax=Lactuca sativa TaxID=4236 RepID=A0A9R1XK70_LACSA|nr:hypothetical protein LSAT_V11C300128970 [Lactuca sativa]
MMNIWKSSPIIASQPTVHTNTRGRPRVSTKSSQAKPSVPPSQDPPRRSYSTYAPDYLGSNMFDLNQQSEPEKHNTYLFGESSIFNREPTYQRSYFDHALMDAITSEFQPYVTNIQNLEGDGHCGFQTVAVALGYCEGYCHQIRTDLYIELLMHIDDYRVLFANHINTISEALNFYETPAIAKYWMIMPDSGILIASKYDVIAHFLSKLESSTSFPLWNGPQDFPNHPIINIAPLNDVHYVNVDLQEGHPMTNVYWIWNIHKSTHSTR